MKKILFLALFFSLFMASCSLNQESTGSVYISLPAAGTATRGILDFNIVHFEITLEGPSPDSRSAKPGDNITFDSLIAGTYTLSITGYGINPDTKEDVKVREGKEENINVESGATTEVTVTLLFIEHDDVITDEKDGETGEVIQKPEIDDGKHENIIAGDEKHDDIITEEGGETGEVIQKPEIDDGKHENIIVGDEKHDDIIGYDSPDYIGLNKNAKGVVDFNGRLCYITEAQPGDLKEFFRVVKDGEEQDITSVTPVEGSAFSTLGQETFKITTSDGEEHEADILIMKKLKPTNLSINGNKLNDDIPEIGVSFELLGTTDTISNPVNGVNQINAKDSSEVLVSYTLKSADDDSIIKEGEIPGIDASQARFVITKDVLKCYTPGEYKIILVLKQYPKSEYEMYYIGDSREYSDTIVIE